MKLCTVLKNVLAKAPKIIPRNKEKGHFGPFLGPLLSPKQFKKKCFKGTLMASSMVFRGNLWKMSQQIGVNNLDKNAILTYFGLFLEPGAHPAKKYIFLLEILKYDPLRKYVLF